jgi:OPA family glycerol-3-phosphate transporter-like MFS transporter
VSAPETRLRGRRALAYALTWTSYASYYLARKGLPVAKVTIEKTLGEASLRGVETAYLAAYAAGQYVNGWLGDRIGARRLIGAGMLLSAAACVAFGASTTAGVFLVAWVVNGLAQSTGWPGNIKAMAEWTPPESRGAVMGVWSTCYQVGGIVATSIAVRFLVAWGRPWAFYGPAVIMAAVGVAVLLLLGKGPLAPAKVARGGESPELRAARVALLKSPIVASLGLSYFCMKLIRYAILFSAPKYLATELHYDAKLAADVSTAFEWGGVLGAVGIGLLSDRLRRVPRAAIAAACLVGLGGAFALYMRAGSGVGANVAGLALLGFLLFGPDALVSGAAAQDAGGPHSAALAAGLVNGLGSLGAIFQEAVLRGVSARWGWPGVFELFGALSVLGAVNLIPAVVIARRSARQKPGLV